MADEEHHGFALLLLLLEPSWWAAYISTVVGSWLDQRAPLVLNELKRGLCSRIVRIPVGKFGARESLIIFFLEIRSWRATIFLLTRVASYRRGLFSACLALEGARM